MEKMPSNLKQMIFAIVLNQKKSDDNNALIHLLAPHMKNVNSLDDIRHTQELFRLFFSHHDKHCFLPKYILPKYNPPLQYLIQLKRFDLFRHFIDNEIYQMQQSYLH